MDHGKAVVAGQGQQLRHHRHDGAQRRHVVAEGGTETARVEEIPLHVDHHQGGGGGLDPVRVRARLHLHPEASR